VIFTKTNADVFGRVINNMIDSYISKNARKASAFTSMGQLKYLSTLRFVDAMVGNSSSGMVEAPSFKIGTINIGDRQKGRIRARSIIDCEPSVEGVREAFKKLYSEDFRENLNAAVSPYGDGKAAKRIFGVIKDTDFTTIKKSFHDMSLRNIQ
jgi:GDP/UDP-N,N'-diacetylbacillosamine 2-epimerase (hydrolysing)